MDIVEKENDILSRYPGSSTVVLAHVKRAVTQLTKGETFGIRQTPVVSFWLMRDKWRGRGVSWHQEGTDGDPVYLDGMIYYPSSIKLVYFKTYEGLVCQLAYIIKEGAGVREWEYERARNNMPQTIEKEYSGHFGVSSKDDGRYESPDQMIMDSMNQVWSI